VLLSGIDAEYFFSDVLDKACGHNSPFKMRDIPAIAAFPPPSGTASDRFMSLWEVENDSSSDTSNEKRRLLRAIEQRLEECVLSQQPMDMYLESYDSFEEVVGNNGTPQRSFF